MASDKKGVSATATGVLGAVIGAAATAAAIALSDEKNRKKAQLILNDLQSQGDKVLKEISRRAMQLKEMGEPKKIAAKKKK